MMTLKLYKYMKSGETLANIVDRVHPISQERRYRLIDFVMDLGRADEIVERIAIEKDAEMRRKLFDSVRSYIRKYLELGYSGVFELFMADLNWNRNRSVRNSVELSRSIYRFISKNIIGFYDSRIESLIITSNLLDDLSDMRKDGTFNVRYLLELLREISTYSIRSLPLILKNIDLLYSLVINVKYIVRGGFESEILKNTNLDINRLNRY